LEIVGVCEGNAAISILLITDHLNHLHSLARRRAMFLTTMQATFPKPIQATTGRRELVAVLLAIAVVTAAYWAPGDLSMYGRMALTAFGLSVIGWTLTKLNDTFVALLAASGLVLTGTIAADEFFASIGNSVVWLMIGAFIVARALNQSGLSARFTYAMTSRARTVSQLFYLLTVVLLVTALVIPSTSGRAALLVPVYQAIASTLQNPRINRALALALPVNILLTAIGSLVGAGAHLVINDTLAQMTGSRFSFGEWVLMGMPFAIVSAFASTWVILHLFLNRQERRLRLDTYLRSQMPQPGAWTRQERTVALVTLALVGLWASEAWHGIDNALVAVLGALAVTIPNFGALKFKEAAKGVEWELILFVAASLALSEALVRSGAGRWLVDLLMVRSGLSALESQVAILVGVVVITLTSHMYITSRSARGAVIAPLVILLALSMGLDPRVLAWVTAAGIGYCITLVVSAKPLAMFQQMDGDQPVYSAGDLVRLSGVLAPLHVGLILLFALFYWPQMVKPLQAAGGKAPQAMLAASPVMQQSPGLLRNRSLVPNPLLTEAGIVRIPTVTPAATSTPTPVATPTLRATPTKALQPGMLDDDLKAWDFSDNDNERKTLDLDADDVLFLATPSPLVLVTPITDDDDAGEETNDEVNDDVNDDVNDNQRDDDDDRPVVSAPSADNGGTRPSEPSLSPGNDGDDDDAHEQASAATSPPASTNHESSQSAPPPSPPLPADHNDDDDDDNSDDNDNDDDG
jgi:anion transporter